MTIDNSFVEEVLHRLHQTGDVKARKMFGGVGLFNDGLMFALIADNELYLKADNQSVHFFEQMDCPAFSYSKTGGKVFKMSYYLAPETFFEDIDETIKWTGRAQDAARRAPRKTNHKTKSKP